MNSYQRDDYVKEQGWASMPGEEQPNSKVAEAISEIRNLQPDVVILDIQMPDGSGIEVLRNIKQAEASPMVIILTNYPYQKPRQKCLEAGADFFLDKSIEFDQIPKLLAQFK